MLIGLSVGIIVVGGVVVGVAINGSRLASQYSVLDNWDRWYSSDEESGQSVMIAENGPKVAVVVVNDLLGLDISIWDDNDDGKVDREIINGATFLRGNGPGWKEIDGQFRRFIIKCRLPEFKLDKDKDCQEGSKMARELST